MTGPAKKNLLIVGAGPGFARCTAREFGAQGWSLHLLARSQRNLDTLAETLGVDADVHTFVGDVTQSSAISELVTAIDTEYPLDACVFQPRGGDDLVDVLDATVDNVRPNLDLLVLGAVAVGQALVPRMIERGDGCLVFVGGGSARSPLPVFGNLGMAMAGLRTYALTLNAAMADRGVHSAFYTVAGMIGAEDAVKSGQLDPRQLAKRMHALVRDRDAREVLMTPDGEVVPKGAR